MTTPPAPLHPGRILFEQAMKPLHVSRNKLARDIDVPVGRISDIVAGKRGVTPDTALRLAKYFGTSAELWMRLQSEFDLHVSRSTTWAKVEPRVRAFEEVEGGATHSLPGEKSSAAGDAALAPVPAAPSQPQPQPAMVEPSLPPLQPAPVATEPPPPPAAPAASAPEPPPVAPVMPAPPEVAGLQVPASFRESVSQPAPPADVPPLRAVRPEAGPAAPPTETAQPLIPGRPAARLGTPAAPAPAPELADAAAAEALDESLDIPDPEDPFLLEPRFEIKSD